MPHLSKVADLLYISSLSSASDVCLLKQHDIACVISILNIPPSIKRIRNMSENRIKLFHFTMDDADDADLLPVARRARSFACRYTSIGKRVLFHCHAGISRSAAVLCFFLMREGLPANAALKLIEEGRPMVCPNDGFMKQLNEEDARLAPKRERKLRDEMALVKLAEYTSSYHIQ